METVTFGQLAVRRSLFTTARPAVYVAPSGERYTLQEDIPRGHVTLKGRMIPDDKGTTIYEWFFDAACGKFKLWEAMLDNQAILKDAEVRCLDNCFALMVMQRPLPLNSVLAPFELLHVTEPCQLQRILA